MGRYRKIDPRIHNDAKYKALSERGKLLTFTILTHPHMTALGAMRATEAGLCQEMTLGASKKDADCPANCPADRGERVFESYQRAFRRLIKIGLIKYDPANACLVIPNFLKYNPPESPSVVKAWNKSGDLIPECPLRDELIVNTLNFLREYVEGEPDEDKKEKRKSFLKAFLLRPSNPQPERQTGPQADGQGGAQQEQEQEQEQEKNNPPTPKGGIEEDFDVWWKEYPTRRKTGKPKVIKKWGSLAKAQKLLPLEEMLQVLRRQKAGKDWLKDGGDFIPGPHKYLNQFMFMDESVGAAASTVPSHQPAKEVITPENVHLYADPNCPDCKGAGMFTQTHNGIERRVRCDCTDKKGETDDKS